METKNLHITKLLLDSENPRHDVINNQKEIIAQLLDTEKIDNLAKDIAEQGALSPLESVGVLQLEGSGGEYIVLEGNRRICACMLLNNPALCPNDNLRKRFEIIKGKESSHISEEVNCIVFHSRADADHWIQLRHEGQQDGRGTKSWDATQIARYAQKRGRRNPNIQAIKLLDFAENHGLISAADRTQYSITTLQRYLSNPVFRNLWGLGNKEDLISKHDLETFKKLTKRFLSDAVPDDSGYSVVNSRSKGADWREYANTLQREITDPPPNANPAANYESGEKKQQNSNTPKSEKNIERSKPDPAKRKYLIPYNVKFSISDKILNRVYKEMQRTEVDQFEFSAAYLLRAFVEGSILLYMEKYLSEEIEKQSKLHNRIGRVCDHLQQQGVKKGKLQPLKLAASETNSVLSPFMIGAMIHLSVLPTKRELISIWDRLEGALKIIHEKL